jgi:tetratricopeptide (TPR) repeat protein
MSPDSSNRHHCEDSIKSLIDENQRSQSRDKTATNLRAIVEFSSTAIGLPDVPQLADSDFFFYRGNAFFQLYRLSGDRASLESAVNDLLLAPRNDGRARAILDAIVQRSRILRKESALSEAVNLLEVAEGILRQRPSSRIRKDFHEQVQGNIADCKLRLSILSKDIAAAKIHCRTILSLRHYALRLALPLHYAAQMLLDAPLDENSRDLLREILLLIDKASRQPNLSVDAIRQLSSHVASLALSLGNEYLELALEQHLRSSAAGQGRFDNALKCSTICRLSLGVGKRLLRTGHETAAFDHFRDAISWLRKALDLNEQSGGSEPLFDLSVTHGCLGETYLRLQGIDGGASLGRHALRHFEEARQIGDLPPESLSMMGDAHFRIGRYLRDPEHLKSAVKFKVDATNLGKPTREGWSVCSAAAFQLFALEGNIEWLRQAISACVNAHQVDPKWPWPFLQLANFVRSNSADNEISKQIHSLLPAVLPTQDLASSLGDTLRARAVELVIENYEFEWQVLGGRTQVFVLSDQHRLISSEIVLKPTLTTQARTEMNATLSLADFLKGLKLDDKFRVPTPVTIKDIGSGKAIYVMERAEGQTLAEALSSNEEHYRNTTAIDYFRAALEFLAAYQAWRLRKGSDPRVFVPD